MKKYVIIFAIVLALVLFLSMPSYTQSNKNIGKSFYTSEEVKKMCGARIDTAIMAKLYSIYKNTISKTETSEPKLLKTETIPNWRPYMSSVKDQGPILNCWAHAATGIVEGQIQIMKGSIIGDYGIDLDEFEFNPDSSRGSTISGLCFIQYHKVRSDTWINPSYPNLKGVRWGVTGVNYVVMCTNPMPHNYNINTMKTALQNGPVTAVFDVYDDFSPFFRDYPQGVYHKKNTASKIDGHAIAIVSYNDADSSWLCKNSWGSAWGDGGYFRIGYKECGIDSLSVNSVTVNQSCYAKIVPNLFLDLNTACSYPFIVDSFYYGPDYLRIREWAQVLSGVTINSGNTLTVPPKATIAFANGSSLTINGTLNASGTPSTPITFDFVSPNSSTQNGIKLNNGSGASTISYCIILNAYRGIHENGVNINISNSAIKNCTYGIYLYGSNPVIQNSNIHDNTYGIYLTSSSPYLYNNFIQYNSSIGVYCSTSSNPKFGNGSTQGKNNITGNNQGVYSWNNSYPVLGKSSPLDGGYNNLINTQYNVNNMTGSPIYAQNIWWGNTNPSYFKIAGTGSVLYNPYRTSSVIVPTPPLSKSGENIYDSGINIPYLSELNKADELLAVNNFEEARNICLDIINNHPDQSIAYNALNLLRDTYTDAQVSSAKNVFKSIFNTKKKDNLYAMAGLILADIDKENKLKHIDEVIENYKGENITELALFDKFVFYYFEKEDKLSAVEILKELDSQFPLSQGAIEAHRILGDELCENIEVNKEKVSGKTIAEDPAENSLLGNYPNPFNPSTVISYKLAVKSEVRIRIYDILGREVAALVNGVKESGHHSVQFDGSNLSSGVYFIRMHAQPQEGQPIILVKKMLMMK